MKKFIYAFLSLFVFFSLEAQTIKVGSLQYGSVNWELKLIKELELDKKNNFNLEIIELASKNAAAVALQGGAVDLM